MHGFRTTTKYSMNDIRITYTEHKIGNSKSVVRKVLNVHNKVMGHKDEQYYETELEMLKIKKYDYESLSEDEKIIYNKNKNQ